MKVTDWIIIRDIKIKFNNKFYVISLKIKRNYLCPFVKLMRRKKSLKNMKFWQRNKQNKIIKKNYFKLL